MNSAIAAPYCMPRRFATEAAWSPPKRPTNAIRSKDDAETAALRVTWQGFGANVVLSIGKAAAGIASGSAGMIADAVHSASDTLSDIVTLFVVKLTRRPADERHPYGYGKSEPLGTLVISGLVVMAGAGIGHESYEALRVVLSSADGCVPLLSNAPLAFAAALASVVVKEALYHMTVKVGKEVNSSVLIANAWHHRSDALSSLIAGAGVFGHWAGVPALDPISGGIVAVMVVRMGMTMGWDAIRELMDAQVDAQTLDNIHVLALGSSSDILEVHDIRCRVVGPSLFVDLQAVVPAHLSISAAHQAEALLERFVREREPRVAEVSVHMHPSFGADDEPMVDASDEDVRSLVSGIIETDFPDVQGVPSLVCHFFPSGKLGVEMAIWAPSLQTLGDARQLAAAIKARLREKMTRTCVGCRCVDIVSVDVRLALLEE